jgi:hypothetical protein
MKPVVAFVIVGVMVAAGGWAFAADEGGRQAGQTPDGGTPQYAPIKEWDDPQTKEDHQPQESGGAPPEEPVPVKAAEPPSGSVYVVENGNWIVVKSPPAEGPYIWRGGRWVYGPVYSRSEWVPGHWRGGYWHPGHWRPLAPVGAPCAWKAGHWRRGAWVPGHCAGHAPRKSGWVPGHYNRRGAWVPGHWR